MAAVEPLQFWLYASSSCLAEESRLAAVDQIVTASLLRNERLAVTGALFFTGAQFAQYLEGPATGLALIRQSIVSDPRHRDIRTIQEGGLEGRRFATWSLAYASPSPVFDRLVGLAHQLKGRSGRLLLLEMMRRFTRGGDPPGR